MDGDGQLPRAGAGLNDNVRFLDAGCQELLLGSSNKRINDCRVPARVDDADAQTGAVVMLRRGALERHYGEMKVVICSGNAIEL